MFHSWEVSGHTVYSCLIICIDDVGPWWCKANHILIYQGVHCCTNVCYLHLDISPLKSVTIEYLEQDVTIIPSRICA